MLLSINLAFSLNRPIPLEKDHKLREIQALEAQMQHHVDPTKRCMSEEEFLFLQTRYGVVYPENLKMVAKSIGFGNLTPIMRDFYECLDNIYHYKAYPTIAFIKTLLDFDISVTTIDDLEYDIINKSFQHPEVDAIYNSIYDEFDCVEIAVNTFDDTYNCYIVLMLTGPHIGCICKDEWTTIKHGTITHNFSSFNLVAPLEDYIINQRKEWLRIHNRVD